MRKNKSLIRKLAILSVLLMLFGFLAISTQTTANSLLCCRDCLGEDELCAGNCNDYYASLPNQTEETEAAWEYCLTRCSQMRNHCSYQYCDHGCTRPCSPGDCGVTGCSCNTGVGACYCSP